MVNKKPPAGMHINMAKKEPTSISVITTQKKINPIELLTDAQVDALLAGGDDA